MYTQPTVLIDGRWETRERRLPVTDPSDGSTVGSVDWPELTQACSDVAAAADAAAGAFESWSTTPARERAAHLLRAADRLEARVDELAPLLAREAGKRLPEAAGELRFSVEYLRWFAEQARRPHGELLTGEHPDRRHLTRQRPSGVVASLTPWNFPCSIQARKLAPALAAGCTVVARVSEKAPLAVTELVRCFTDADLPRGVLNLVHGPAAETTEQLLAHDAVRVVSFTGSTGVGRRIMELASRRIVRPLLELGGNAPFVVLDDADVDAAVEGAMLGRFRNTGQSCVAANRFLVHQRVYDEFVGALVEQVDAMTIGGGLDEPCPDLGPVIDDERARAVQKLVDGALGAGGRRLTALPALPAGGSFVPPTLVADVPADDPLVRDEVFGPAAAIVRVASDAEAVAEANRTETGLAGYVWSGSLTRAWRLSERLDAGIVGVNDPLPSVAFAPMGGTKQSGLGREGAADGLAEFTDVQYTTVRL